MDGRPARPRRSWSAGFLSEVEGPGGLQGLGRAGDGIPLDRPRRLNVGGEGRQVLSGPGEGVAREAKGLDFSWKYKQTPGSAGSPWFSAGDPSRRTLKLVDSTGLTPPSFSSSRSMRPIA
jgi:hypothetical protein